MIIEEIIPHRIRELLAACRRQPDLIRRFIIEVEPNFQPDELRILINSSKWAHAVNPNLIISPHLEQQQFERARAILENLVKTKLDNKNFLDYGCGKGYVTKEASSGVRISVGYDLDIQQQKNDKFTLTDNWDTVGQNAPFDIILVYDVLDHSKDDHPIDVMKKIKNVLAEDGIIYVRCHPWCSRSGTHLYHTVNKAWIHLFFTEDQIEEMGGQGIWTRRIIHPITFYDDVFLKAGLEIKSTVVKRETVEPFFLETPILKDMLRSHWKYSFDEKIASGEKLPTYQMEVTHMDYALKHRFND